MDQPRRILVASFWLLILLAPTILGLMWGDHFADPIYDSYITAQNLAAGRGLTQDAAIGVQTPLASPLFVAILALFGTAVAPWLGLILSALGWGAIAAVTYAIGLRLKRPLVAIVAAVLVAFCPIIFLTLGGTASLGVAFVGMALLWSHDPRVKSKVGAIPLDVILLLLLVIQFDLSTVAFVLLLGGIQWVERRWSLRRLSIWLIVIVGLIAIITWRFGMPFELQPYLGNFDLPSFVRDGELYWLFLPLMVLGFVSVNQASHEHDKRLWVGIAWLLISALVGSPIALALTAVTTLFLASLGLEWSIQRIIEQNLFQLARPRLTVVLTIVFLSPLLIAQMTSLWQQYRARPLAQFALEEAVAGWLREHSEPTATLFTSGRIGYLADRATIPAEINQRNSSEWAELFAVLMDGEPDFFVSSRAINWSFVTGTGWFKERYQPQTTFTTPYAPNSPFTIWQYTSTPFDIGEMQAADATVSDKLKLVGYKYAPKQIAPGDDIYVTIHLQATKPITAGFNTAVYVVHPIDGEIWAWQDAPTPRAIPAEWWQSGQIITERFRIPTELEVPFGAYKLELLWRTTNEEKWPVYQGDDTNVLDRLLLGYVAVPPPVEIADATPANARFGDQIGLSGFEVIGEPAPGEQVEVVLYWQALRPPDDNFAVFVHLSDQAEQFVTGHDGQPMENRFPTKGWQPGTIIRDSHPLSLPPDLLPGEYQVKVGLYLQQTGVRLPVWDRQDVEQPDRSFPLLSIEIK